MSEKRVFRYLIFHCKHRQCKWAITPARDEVFLLFEKTMKGIFCENIAEICRFGEVIIRNHNRIIPRIIAAERIGVQHRRECRKNDKM